jgi:hypothetical protein
MSANLAERDPGAFARKGQNDRAADVRAASPDDQRLVLQPQIHRTFRAKSRRTHLPNGS